MLDPYDSRFFGHTPAPDPKFIYAIHKTRHTDMLGHRVYIGRPSVWGNPFASKPSRVGKQISLAEWQAKPNAWDWLRLNQAHYTIRVSSAVEAVTLYRQYLRYLWRYSPLHRNELLILARYFKNENEHLLLECWCKHSIHDDTPCHGDALKDAILGIIAHSLV